MTCDEVFEVLAKSSPSSADLSKEIDAHLEGCEECRRMKRGLAAYDEALEAPERFQGDPPHVRDAILAASRAKAAEFRAAATREDSFSRRLGVAAAAVALVAAGFVAGRLTGPRVVVLKPLEGPTVSVGSDAR